MTLETKPFDISEHLNTPDEIRTFLQEVLETGEESDFIHALSIAAKAAGMACIVTTSTYTVEEDFTGANRIVPMLGESGDADCITLADLRELLPK